MATTKRLPRKMEQIRKLCGRQVNTQILQIRANTYLRNIMNKYMTINSGLYNVREFNIRSLDAGQSHGKHLKLLFLSCRVFMTCLPYGIRNRLVRYMQLCHWFPLNFHRFLPPNVKILQTLLNIRHCDLNAKRIKNTSATNTHVRSF